jgi:hypothetical protein
MMTESGLAAELAHFFVTREADLQGPPLCPPTTGLLYCTDSGATILRSSSV